MKLLKTAGLFALTFGLAYGQMALAQTMAGDQAPAAVTEADDVFVVLPEEATLGPHVPGLNLNLPAPEFTPLAQDQRNLLLNNTPEVESRGEMFHFSGSGGVQDALKSVKDKVTSGIDTGRVKFKVKRTPRIEGLPAGIEQPKRGWMIEVRVPADL